MFLEEMVIQGFRPFRDPIIIDFQNLTFLIGNNDSGKSSIIDILDIALSGSAKPDEKDFFSCPSGKCQQIEVTMTFQVYETEEEAQKYSNNGLLKFRVKYELDNKSEEYLTQVPVDEDLRCDFGKLNASDQKRIIEKFDPEALTNYKNSASRIEWYKNFISSTKKIEDWEKIPRSFYQILPLVQRYSAMDYSSPESVINKTVTNIFESVLYTQPTEDSPQKELKKSLKELSVEAEEKINAGINELSNLIKQYAPNIVNIHYVPQIDFMRGFLTGDFRIDEGNGEHYLDRSGDGTKRKIFMATTEWDRDVTLKIQEEGSLRSVIRAYDEPDTNLDYQAQHQLFDSINQISNGQNSNIQSIICTHSPRMIDRAPALSIRKLSKDENGVTIKKINVDCDNEVKFFLSDIARDLGISNTLMFYEKCFIFVEGETEENALPLFYRTLYGRSLLEDGINIINVKGKGAFKEFLRLFSKNRQELSIFLMDQDCETSNDKKLTIQELKENGFTDEFCETRVLLVGTTEFEDIFSPSLYTRIYNSLWPKSVGNWKEDDFNQIDKLTKISTELKKLCFTLSDPNSNKWSKPELGLALGKISKENNIPEEIKTLFNLSRKIAKINKI